MSTEALCSHPGAGWFLGLFLGEKMHVSGLDLLAAIVVGYEAGVGLVRRRAGPL